MGERSRAGWLSRYARRRKLEHLLSFVEHDARILDFGCADGWASRWMRDHGWHDVTGLDLQPPAEVVGDIRRWESLGLERHSFDAVVAFEVLEHGDFAAVVRELLAPGGRLVATTPVPRWDWVCRAMEKAHILQERTGPHTDLVDLRAYPGFSVVDWRVKGLVSQWAVLTPA
jgi:2-polyprenyl-3-methyl-5-hydroxy-6-metoxy-1,4-benzoquinol methylase